MDKFIVKYLYGKNPYYSYKMFDKSEEAVDFILELKSEGTKKVKLYQAQEIEIEYKVEVKGVKYEADDESIANIFKSYAKSEGQ